ncbi:peroxiredoxin [Thiohalophilus thiocyanatoxydans]|uniref:thioredoxin-dependent peroxiredoxin n=1 Tax=Thiohalophilus thiocyanatoxydans TaxID=381308 RepID=A0A4R8ITX3_9GAMM|nr:peroxiredoxin [Thiohalophilus thiocyanatoxydans]TDY02880.1 peroxiredoxin Q/BCP [Thiohalophilus thiocyanatoxydans]
MLQSGQMAPDFCTPNQDDKTVCLGDFRNNKHVIVYFYPKDDTPGCTIEANQFTELADEFAQQDTVILGVSKDDCDSHRQFISKFGLRVDLLADTSGELCEKYGVWQEKEKNGEKKMGVVRSTFVIDKTGKLVHVEYGVNPEGHAQAMLKTVQEL